MLPMKLQDEESLLLLQRALGQLLFYPPNVAGWPGGRNWIDSSTLMLRMRIPQLLNETDEFNIRPKDDDDQMMGRRDGNASPAKPMAGAGRMGRAIRVEIDWKPLLKGVESVPREKLLATLSDTLLQTRPQWPSDLIRGFSDESGRANFVKTATLQLMSTPEYQLC
jgi:hypothetical protein